MPEETMRAALQQFLSAQTNTDVVIRELRRITVGHSRAMYRVDCASGDRYVLRMEQGGVFGTSSIEEFGVMARLAELGVPVAAARWFEPTGSVLGQPFFVMDFLPGAEGADERAIDVDTARAFVHALHALHGIGADASVPFADAGGDPLLATHRQIDRWAAIGRSGGSSALPLLDEAAAWLHHHAPPLTRVGVVHADAGPGNFVHADSRVVAFTDWEFAHLGDPNEDWVYVAAMRGSRTMSRERWSELFAEVGVVLDPPTWRYWEAFNLFKGACANRTCLRLFVDGTNPAPNMAIIGTHLHQAFLRRLVDLID